MKAAAPEAGIDRMLRESLCLLALFGPLDAEPVPMATTGLTPDQALRRMTMAEGFAVDLIAAEPDVVQPIAICFDARGRLWVAEAPTYPQRAPDGAGKDRLLIFEDTDGDGRYDSRKVFVEGLNLVSGLETGFGGVFVGAAPHLLFIPDRDGDDKPDGPPEVLLDGFGYQDTHETLNSFIWGPDGWLWGCHGVFTHSRVGKPGTPDAQRVPINAGVWKMDPRTHRFEVVSHGTSNPWGLDFNDWGDAFVEACVIPHFWHMIPGGHYQRQAGADFNPAIYDPIPTIADHAHWTGNIADHAHWGHENVISGAVSDAGGGHAHSGLAICLSDAFPPEFRNSALMFNIHGHRLNRDMLVRNGSGWTARHAKDVFLSNDAWFLGVSIRPAPDGSMVFNDWYDATSCHRTDPLRWDRGNGRLYRLRHGDLKPWRGDLATWSDLKLAQTQAGRDEWQIRMARKTLQERMVAGRALDPEARDALVDTLENAADETRRLRALWTLRTCGQLDAGRVARLMADRSDAVRAWAVRIGAEDGLAVDQLGRLAAEETSPVVQLALGSALQRVSPEIAIDLAESLVARLDPADPNLTRLLWFGIERGVPAQAARAIALALRSRGDALIQWTARRLPPGEALEPLCAALAGAGGRQPALLDAIRRRLQWQPDERLTPHQATLLAALDFRTNPVARELAARAGNPDATAQLWTAVRDEKAGQKARSAALAVLAALPDPDPTRWQALLEIPSLALEAMETRPELIDLPAAETAISGFDAEQKARVARLALRANRQPQLLRWLQTGRLRKHEVPAEVIARLRELADPAAREIVTATFGEAREGAAARQQAIAEWKQKLTPELIARADPRRGRALFDRTCSACHQLFGEGGKIGPELTGGDRANLSHWLDNILDPNALIGAGYELHQLTLKDGTTATGIPAAGTDTEMVLTLVGAETRVPRKNITANQALGVSMMPEGLIDGWETTDVAALIRYLGAPAQVKPE